VEACLIEAGPLVQLQISLSRIPWRIAPAWSVLAGALAVAPSEPEPALALRVVAALVLGDMTWGLLRRYKSPGGDINQAGEVQRVHLPYSQDYAPLSRGVGALALSGVRWQDALAGSLLALGGALLIGASAVVLSVLALFVTAAARPSMRRGETPAASFALLDVPLPWLLGMLAAGWTYVDFSRWQPLLVAIAFGVLEWSLLRVAIVGSVRRSVEVGFGVLVVLCVLVALGMPWATATVAVLLAPPMYWLSSSGSEHDSIAARSVRAGPWMLVALLIAARALR
jgi:hypothetical protein